MRVSPVAPAAGRNATPPASPKAKMVPIRAVSQTISNNMESIRRDSTTSVAIPT